MAAPRYGVLFEVIPWRAVGRSIILESQEVREEVY
jgi:hypothetical protein